MRLKFVFIFFIPLVMSDITLRFMNNVLVWPAEWNCLAFEELTQVAIQVYTETGEISQLGIANMNNFHSIIPGFDVVYTPCLQNCKNSKYAAKDQIAALMDACKEGLIQSYTGLEGLTVWIDIDEGLPWSTNKTKNQEFIMEAIDTIFSYNFTNIAGVIANATTWSKVFGSAFTKPAQHPEVYLWWRYWNGHLGPYDWAPFGGWTVFDDHEYMGGVSNNTCAPGAKFSYAGTTLPYNLIRTEDSARKVEPDVKTIMSSYDEEFARNVLYPLSISVTADNSSECLSSYFGSNITIVDVADVTCLPFITDTCKGMMAVDDLNKKLFLIFRGTTSNGTQIINELFNLELVPYPGIWGNVVKYFADAFTNLWFTGDLKSKFFAANHNYPNYSLIISGHSLGGSISSIAAAYIIAHHLAPNFTSISLITMGEPRTGDLLFANTLDSKLDVSIRIVHGLDPIPHFPIRNPSQELTTYAHHGSEYWYSLGMYKDVGYHFCPTSENATVIVNCSDRLEPTNIYWDILNYGDIVAPYHVTYWQKNITSIAANNCQNV